MFGAQVESTIGPLPGFTLPAKLLVEMSAVDRELNKSSSVKHVRVVNSS
jgi:hypothetical protein